MRPHNAGVIHQDRIEAIADKIERGWIGIVHKSPESSCDVMLIDCALPPDADRLAGIARAVAIDEWDIDGDTQTTLAWTHIPLVSAGHRAGIRGRLYDTGCWLLTSGIQDGLADLECVYKDEDDGPCSPDNELFRPRIRQWFHRTIRLARLLNAFAAQIDGDYNGPIIVWSRDG